MIPLVMTLKGQVSGAIDDATGVFSFEGIPFAAPPVGDLRWKTPQPVQPWSGVREAGRFGPRAMQLPIFGDMNSARWDERRLPLRMFDALILPPAGCWRWSISTAAVCRGDGSSCVMMAEMA
jgi:hypothetical protein